MKHVQYTAGYTLLLFGLCYGLTILPVTHAAVIIMSIAFGMMLISIATINTYHDKMMKLIDDIIDTSWEDESESVEIAEGFNTKLEKLNEEKKKYKAHTPEYRNILIHEIELLKEQKAFFANEQQRLVDLIDIKQAASK